MTYGMIELKNISKEFKHKGKSVLALDNVSLTVPEGKIIGIIGESGAGKSTLVRCVNLLERPSSGEVIVGGKNLMKLSSAELTAVRRKTGMIFQHFNLLSSRTVAGNVAFPIELTQASRGKIRNRVSELLQMVGLEDRAEHYPAQLSGGQKQRVAIARALANEPDVLLCDEATSALDPDSTENILTLLKDINATLRLTILLITHEMNVARRICGDVAVMSGGRLVGRGFDNKWFYPDIN
jgi:D-methionine transport system ATP-binding protein